MATNTYVALRTTTVTGSSVSSVTLDLTGISGYTDLVVVANYGITNDGYTLAYRVNGDTGTNYSWTYLRGNGSSPLSYRKSGMTLASVADEVKNDNFNTAIINFQNYSNSTTFKTSISRTGNAGRSTAATVSLWRSTSPITSIVFAESGDGGTGTFSTGNITVGSTFTIYGIATQPAVSTAKATGGTITYDAFGRVIHTFTSSGTFTPSEALAEVEYLVVAGGGGGGNNSGELGGAGGAGGVRSGTASLAAGTGYSVTVGAGGGGGASGSNSTFSALTSTGGGRGGNQGNVGISGGSGGGGANQSQAGGSGNAGAYSPVEGYAGGSGGYYSAGGGGGAGGAGANAGSQVGGNGGTGIVSTITGALVYYGGGGGGSANTRGSGGAGGGGVGASALNGTGAGSGTANTGGGGGGSAGGYGPGSGGSGVVIIRYQG